ncbi:MAG: alpha/beta hydrolase [Acidimicrobiales bacterium]
MLAAADRPELVSGLVLVGPFVRDGKGGPLQRMLLRLLMARPWVAASWKAYLPKLYAGQRPLDFDQHRSEIVASLDKPGHAKAFSLTTRTTHQQAERRLGEVATPVLVVMGEQDPDFPDPKAEAEWTALALHARVVMVADAGHYPQSQQPAAVTSPVLEFLPIALGGS